MANREQVQVFLRELKEKIKIWGILYRDDRGKNAQTLADLELRPIDRDKNIENLITDDYCQGPLEDKLYKGSGMWIFGKEVKKNEVYIKITLGLPSSNIICISFHISEHKLTYPYKNLAL
jgi:hypothetical protein